MQFEWREATGKMVFKMFQSRRCVVYVLLGIMVCLSGCGSGSDDNSTVSAQWRYEQMAQLAFLEFHRDLDGSGEPIGLQSATLTVYGLDSTLVFSEDGMSSEITPQNFAQDAWQSESETVSFLAEPPGARMTYELNGASAHIDLTIKNAVYIAGASGSVIYHVMNLEDAGMSNLTSTATDSERCVTHQERIEVCTVQVTNAHLFIDSMTSETGDDVQSDTTEQGLTRLSALDGTQTMQHTSALFDASCNPFSCVGAVSDSLMVAITVTNPEVDAEVVALKLVSGVEKAEAINTVCSGAGVIAQDVSNGSIRESQIAQPCEAGLRTVTNPLGELVHILANLICGNGFEP